MKESIRNWLITHPKFNPYRLSFMTIFRYLTSPIRLYPDFIIIGFHKCGTTSLYDYLVQHPNIGSASEKELEFFSYAYNRGMNYYKIQFPTKIKKFIIERKTKNKFLTGEASPAYVYHPFAIERIKKHLPNVKLIVLMRNPIDRAYSDYHQDIRRGWQSGFSFEDAIDTENYYYEKMMNDLKNEKIKHYNVNHERKGYLNIGKYIIHLERWIKLFGKENFFLINSADLDNNFEFTMKSLCEFLGVKYVPPKNLSKKNIGNYEKMSESTRKKLIDYYKKYNNELEKFTGQKFDWNQ